ncbi:hypothetical protein EJ08DRAFT_665951 [Tothia fuscella]|uniref:Uncharacterized protein n=1 Tax=Tothia fuscella TaxID=1048955 RepID=A0A9P4NFK3_9PEZI|nr:hypothetical protein EJ08DRAFT_665951 [Tothia fuscella]
MESNPRFMLLSGELRNKIYELILCTNKEIKVDQGSGPSDSRVPGLLQTCRQIRREAFPVYIQLHTFLISQPVTEDSFTGKELLPPTIFKSWWNFNDEKTSFLEYIRHLDFEMPLGVWPLVTQQCPNLHSINIPVVLGRFKLDGNGDFLADTRTEDDLAQILLNLPNLKHVFLTLKSLLPIESDMCLEGPHVYHGMLVAEKAHHLDFWNMRIWLQQKFVDIEMVTKVTTWTKAYRSEPPCVIEEFAEERKERIHEKWIRLVNA